VLTVNRAYDIPLCRRSIKMIMVRSVILARRGEA